MPKIGPSCTPTSGLRSVVAGAALSPMLCSVADRVSVPPAAGRLSLTGNGATAKSASPGGPVLKAGRLSVPFCSIFGGERNDGF